MQPDNHDTILRIYDAVADDSLWPDVLHRLATQLNAYGCIVFEWHTSLGEKQLVAPLASANYDLSAIETYIAKCFEHEKRDQDIFEAHSLAQDQIDLIEDDVLAPDIADLKQLSNVQTLQKLGILHRAAGLLNKDNSAVSRFSLQLAGNRGRLTPEERAHLTTVLPHIAKALDLGRPAKQLALEHQSMLAAMDRLTIGVCILDAKGRVVVENNEFERQQDAYPVFFKTNTGELRLRRPEDQRHFSALMENVFNHGKFGARPRKEAISTSETSFLCVEISPLNNMLDITAKTFGGFIVYSTDTSLPIHCNALPMQRAYGLTDAEMTLVDLIARGLTNGQISERRDRSLSTINTQVKSILAKTHCSTRTQFVRLMMSFGANFLTR